MIEINNHPDVVSTICKTICILAGMLFCYKLLTSINDEAENCQEDRQIKTSKATADRETSVQSNLEA